MISFPSEEQKLDDYFWILIEKFLDAIIGVQLIELLIKGGNLSQNNHSQKLH